MEHTLDLIRIWKDLKQTLGESTVKNAEGNSVLSVFTLELPDLNDDGIKDNEVRKSCIPDGVYEVTRERHHKLGKVFRIHGVKGRSGILIHIGQFYYNTLGCILVGMDQRDLNDDGLIDNVSSTKAMNALWEFDITEIRITTRP